MFWYLIPSKFYIIHLMNDNCIMDIPWPLYRHKWKIINHRKIIICIIFHINDLIFHINYLHNFSYFFI